MPRTPASKDDYLIAVGKVVNNATLSEAYMFTAFKIISGCTTPIASAIFYTLDSIQGKKSLLMRILKEVGDAQDTEYIGAIIEAAKKANNQRREVAHAVILFTTKDGTFPPHEIVSPKSRQSKPLTKDWLSLLIRHSVEACTEGYQAFQKLCEKHGVPAIPEL